MKRFKKFVQSVNKGRPQSSRDLLQTIDHSINAPMVAGMQKAISFLNGHIYAEGIYRHNDNFGDEFMTTESMIESGRVSDVYLGTVSSVYIIAAAVKNILATHDPLVPYNMYDRFLSPVADIAQLIGSLPALNRELLVCVLTHLAKVAANSKNNMDVWDVSSGLGVLILRPAPAHEDYAKTAHELHARHEHFIMMLNHYMPVDQKVMPPPSPRVTLGTGSLKTGRSESGSGKGSGTDTGSSIQDRSVKISFMDPANKPDKQGLKELLLPYGTVVNIGFKDKLAVVLFATADEARMCATDNGGRGLGPSFKIKYLGKNITPVVSATSDSDNTLHRHSNRSRNNSSPSPAPPPPSAGFAVAGNSSSGRRANASSSPSPCPPVQNTSTTTTTAGAAGSGTGTLSAGVAAAGVSDDNETGGEEEGGTKQRAGEREGRRSRVTAAERGGGGGGGRADGVPPSNSVTDFHSLTAESADGGGRGRGVGTKVERIVNVGSEVELASIPSQELMSYDPFERGSKGEGAVRKGRSGEDELQSVSPSPAEISEMDAQSKKETVKRVLRADDSARYTDASHKNNNNNHGMIKKDGFALSASGSDENEEVVKLTSRRNIPGDSDVNDRTEENESRSGDEKGKRISMRRQDAGKMRPSSVYDIVENSNNNNNSNSNNRRNGSSIYNSRKSGDGKFVPSDSEIKPGQTEQVNRNPRAEDPNLTVRFGIRDSSGSDFGENNSEKERETIKKGILMRKASWNNNSILRGQNTGSSSDGAEIFRSLSSESALDFELNLRQRPRGGSSGGNVGDAGVGGSGSGGKGNMGTGSGYMLALQEGLDERGSLSPSCNNPEYSPAGAAVGGGSGSSPPWKSAQPAPSLLSISPPSSPGELRGKESATIPAAAAAAVDRGSSSGSSGDGRGGGAVGADHHPLSGVGAGKKPHTQSHGHGYGHGHGHGRGNAPRDSVHDGTARVYVHYGGDTSSGESAGEMANALAGSAAGAGAGGGSVNALAGISLPRKVPLLAEREEDGSGGRGRSTAAEDGGTTVLKMRERSFSVEESPRKQSQSQSTGGSSPGSLKRRPIRKITVSGGGANQQQPRTISQLEQEEYEYLEEEQMSPTSRRCDVDNDGDGDEDSDQQNDADGYGYSRPGNERDGTSADFYPRPHPYHQDSQRKGSHRSPVHSGFSVHPGGVFSDSEVAYRETHDRSGSSNNSNSSNLKNQQQQQQQSMVMGDFDGRDPYDPRVIRRSKSAAAAAAVNLRYPGSAGAAPRRGLGGREEGYSEEGGEEEDDQGESDSPGRRRQYALTIPPFSRNDSSETASGAGYREIPTPWRKETSGGTHSSDISPHAELPTPWRKDSDKEGRGKGKSSGKRKNRDSFHSAREAAAENVPADLYFELTQLRERIQALEARDRMHTREIAERNREEEVWEENWMTEIMALRMRNQELEKESSALRATATRMKIEESNLLARLEASEAGRRSAEMMVEASDERANREALSTVLALKRHMANLESHLEQTKKQALSMEAEMLDLRRKHAHAVGQVVHWKALAMHTLRQQQNNGVVGCRDGSTTTAAAAMLTYPYGDNDPELQRLKILREIEPSNDAARPTDLSTSTNNNSRINSINNNNSTFNASNSFSINDGPLSSSAAVSSDRAGPAKDLDPSVRPRDDTDIDVNMETHVSQEAKVDNDHTAIKHDQPHQYQKYLLSPIGHTPENPDSSTTQPTSSTRINSHHSVDVDRTEDADGGALVPRVSTGTIEREQRAALGVDPEPGTDTSSRIDGGSSAVHHGSSDRNSLQLEEENMSKGAMAESMLEADREVADREIQEFISSLPSDAIRSTFQRLIDNTSSSAAASSVYRPAASAPAYPIVSEGNERVRYPNREISQSHSVHFSRINREVGAGVSMGKAASEPTTAGNGSPISSADIGLQPSVQFSRDSSVERKTNSEAKLNKREEQENSDDEENKGYGHNDSNRKSDGSQAASMSASPNADPNQEKQINPPSYAEEVLKRAAYDREHRPRYLSQYSKQAGHSYIERLALGLEARPSNLRDLRSSMGGGGVSPYSYALFQQRHLPVTHSEALRRNIYGGTAAGASGSLGPRVSAIPAGSAGMRGGVSGFDRSQQQSKPRALSQQQYPHRCTPVGVGAGLSARSGGNFTSPARAPGSGRTGTGVRSAELQSWYNQKFD